MLKMKLLTFFFVIMSVMAWSQNYNRLIDASGFNTDEYQQELNDAADSLLSVFPTEFQGQFKVYDFGFYLHQEQFDGGYPEVFTNKVAEIDALSPYYLVFGKQTDATGVYSKFWVDLKLPETGEFSCIDLISPELRNDIKVKVSVNCTQSYANFEYRMHDYYRAEIAAMDALKDVVAKYISCCDPGFVTPTCDACAFTPLELFTTMVDYGFVVEDMAEVISDPDWVDISLPSAIGAVDDLNIELRSLDTEENYDADEIIDFTTNRINARHNTPAVIYKYKYPRDCGSFSEDWDNFNDDLSPIKIFQVVLNVDNNMAFMMSYVSAKKNSNPTYFINNEIDSSDYEFQELLLVHEAKEEGGSQNDVCAQPFKHAGLTHIRSLILTDPMAVFWASGNNQLYQTHIKNAHEASEALANSSVLLWHAINKERALIDEEYDLASVQCDKNIKRTIGIWKEAVVNLCTEEIHTFLELCGIGFPACDAVDAVFYAFQGDWKGASISAISIVPVIGDSKYIAKVYNKQLIPSACLTTGFSSSSSGIGCSLIHLVAKNGVIKWIGKHRQLKQFALKHYDDLVASNAFRIFRVEQYTGAKTDWHHVLPWILHKGGRTFAAHPLITKLAERGKWMVSNGVYNALPLAKRFPENRGGGVFHSSAPKYTEYCKRRLDQIARDFPEIDDQAREVIALTEELKDLMVEAWNNTESLNVFFAKLL